MSNWPAGAMSLFDYINELDVCECKWCEKECYEDAMLESILNDDILFCSEDCMREWEEENYHDYEESNE